MPHPSREHRSTHCCTSEAMCPQLSGDSPVCSACVHLLLDREESFDTGLGGAGCQKSFYERVHLMGRLSPVACHELLPSSLPTKPLAKIKRTCLGDIILEMFWSEGDAPPIHYVRDILLYLEMPASCISPTPSLVLRLGHPAMATSPDLSIRHG